jgi:transposase InsO family protein
MGGPADRGHVWLGAGPTAVLIRDRDGRFGIEFDRRVQRLGITQIRTPVRAPRANALAERWIRSARRECLDQVVIINERHLQQVLDLTLEMRLARDLSQRSLPSILRPG